MVRVNGLAYAEPDVWWDTFPLPARGTVTVRSRYRPDVVGKTVYHCHILPHEDNGMMSTIEIQPGQGSFVDVPVIGPFSTGEPIPNQPPTVMGGNLERPYIFTQASQGLTAQVESDARIQIQLPGVPSVWKIINISSADVQPVATTIIPGPGRIPGSEGIYQFDLRMAGKGPVTIYLAADPPVSWLSNPYSLTLKTAP